MGAVAGGDDGVVAVGRDTHAGTFTESPRHVDHLACGQTDVVLRVSLHDGAATHIERSLNVDAAAIFGDCVILDGAAGHGHGAFGLDEDAAAPLSLVAADDAALHDEVALHPDAAAVVGRPSTRHAAFPYAAAVGERQRSAAVHLQYLAVGITTGERAREPVVVQVDGGRDAVGDDE